MKLKLNELDFKSERNPYSEIRKILQLNLGEMTKFLFLISNYLSKSNLNYQNFQDYEGITVLTYLMERLSFKLLWLQRISLILSLS